VRRSAAVASVHGLDPLGAPTVRREPPFVSLDAPDVLNDSASLDDLLAAERLVGAESAPSATPADRAA